MKYPDSVFFSEEVEFPIYGFNLRATCSGREGAQPGFASAGHLRPRGSAALCQRWNRGCCGEFGCLSSFPARAKPAFHGLITPPAMSEG